MKKVTYVIPVLRYCLHCCIHLWALKTRSNDILFYHIQVYLRLENHMLLASIYLRINMLLAEKNRVVLDALFVWYNAFPDEYLICTLIPSSHSSCNKLYIKEVLLQNRYVCHQNIYHGTPLHSIDIHLMSFLFLMNQFVRRSINLPWHTKTETKLRH